MGIGAVIGTGIFILPGHEAAQHAGPAVAISFLLAAIVNYFSSFLSAFSASLMSFFSCSRVSLSNNTSSRISPFNRPEFLNRLDAIVPFNSLTSEDMLKILDLYLVKMEKEDLRICLFNFIKQNQ